MKYLDRDVKAGRLEPSGFIAPLPTAAASAKTLEQRTRVQALAEEVHGRQNAPIGSPSLAPPPPKGSADKSLLYVAPEISQLRIELATELAATKRARIAAEESSTLARDLLDANLKRDEEQRVLRAQEHLAAGDRARLEEEVRSLRDRRTPPDMAPPAGAPPKVFGRPADRPPGAPRSAQTANSKQQNCISVWQNCCFIIHGKRQAVNGA